MGEFETIIFDIDDRGIAAVTLAQPDTHNAISSLMMAELRAVVGRIAQDKSIRACVLGAKGKTFCAGGDLSYMQKQMQANDGEIIEGAHEMSDLLTALDNLPFPLIGKIEGSVYGGGIGLLSVCDIVIASNNIKLALRETLLGMIPATIGPFVLRRIGEAWARQYFFTAKDFDAAIAQQMNLVSTCVAESDVASAVETEILQILRCKPQAVAAAKQLALQLARNPAMDSRQMVAELFSERLNSSEMKEAVKQFLNR